MRTWIIQSVAILEEFYVKLKFLFKFISNIIWCNPFNFIIFEIIIYFGFYSSFINVYFHVAACMSLWSQMISVWLSPRVLFAST